MLHAVGCALAEAELVARADSRVEVPKGLKRRFRHARCSHPETSRSWMGRRA